MGMQVDAYFDPGGIRILLSDERYEDIERDIRAGKLPDSRLLPLTELGYDNRGVPIDLACSADGGSSIVWIKRYVRTSNLHRDQIRYDSCLDSTSSGFRKEKPPHY